jgi:hypothetical protein
MQTDNVNIVISDLLNDILDQIIIMREAHLKKLNAANVRRYRQRQIEANVLVYMSRKREQQRLYRQKIRQNKMLSMTELISN